MRSMEDGRRAWSRSIRWLREAVVKSEMSPVERDLMIVGGVLGTTLLLATLLLFG